MHPIHDQDYMNAFGWAVEYLLRLFSLSLDETKAQWEDPAAKKHREKLRGPSSDILAQLIALTKEHVANLKGA